MSRVQVLLEHLVVQLNNSDKIVEIILLHIQYSSANTLE
jgi:hypothetical protein